MSDAIFIGERVIEDEYYDHLKTDEIEVGEDTIKSAMLGEAKAFHSIGCAYRIRGNEESSGNDHLANEYYGRAIVWLGLSAAMGFYESQLILGNISRERYDNTEAMKWYQFALKNGITSAARYIGEIYYERQDYYNARPYFMNYKDNIDAHVQHRIGMCYCHGFQRSTSCFRSYRHALNWFIKSADQGLSEAQYAVGRIYENGYGINVDKYYALECYHKAKDGGYSLSCDAIKRLNKQGYFYIQKEEIITVNTENN